MTERSTKGVHILLSERSTENGNLLKSKYFALNDIRSSSGPWEPRCTAVSMKFVFDEETLRMRSPVLENQFGKYAQNLGVNLTDYGTVWKV